MEQLTLLYCEAIQFSELLLDLYLVNLNHLQKDKNIITIKVVKEQHMISC